MVHGMVVPSPKGGPKTIKDLMYVGPTSIGECVELYSGTRRVQFPAQTTFTLSRTGRKMFGFQTSALLPMVQLQLGKCTRKCTVRELCPLEGMLNSWWAQCTMYRTVNSTVCILHLQSVLKTYVCIPDCANTYQPGSF